MPWRRSIDCAPAVDDVRVPAGRLDVDVAAADEVTACADDDPREEEEEDGEEAELQRDGDGIVHALSPIPAQNGA